MNDELLDNEIIRSNSIVHDFAEFAAFFAFHFETYEVEIEREDFADFDNIFGIYKFVGTINYHAKIRIFAYAGSSQKIGAGTGDRAAFGAKGDDFEGIWIYNTF